LATAREGECSRIARILKDTGRNYDFVFDQQEGEYIRFTVRRAGTTLLNPSSGHLTGQEIATKSDDVIRQLLTSLSHALITF
jgi:hypothetical protein